jgi:hypothetical protein
MTTALCFSGAHHALTENGMKADIAKFEGRGIDGHFAGFDMRVSCARHPFGTYGRPRSTKIQGKKQ